jgi:hypothetical protein
VNKKRGSSCTLKGSRCRFAIGACVIKKPAVLPFWKRLLRWFGMDSRMLRYKTCRSQPTEFSVFGFE